MLYDLSLLFMYIYCNIHIYIVYFYYAELIMYSLPEMFYEIKVCSF